MADSKEILIEIKTNMADSLETLVRLQKQLDAVKVEQMKVEAAFKSGQKSREDADKELQALAATQRSLSSDMKSVKKEIDNQTKAYKLNEGSIQQMRAELANMRKEYEEMSKAERNSAKGDALLGKIKSTTDELKKLEAAQGDYRRNVGNYASAFDILGPRISKVVKGFANLSGGTMKLSVAFRNGVAEAKSFVKFLANPFVAAFSAIVLVLKGLVEQFKKSDDAMTALQKLFAAFQPVLDVVVGTFDALAKVLTKVVGGITKAVTAVMSLIPAFGESSKAAQDYVQAMDDLEEKERDYKVQRARNDAEIATLRDKAAQSDKYTSEQRIGFLKKAKELEEENLNMEVEVARRKYELAKQDAERRKDTSDDTKNMISDLEAAYYNAIASAEQGMRRLSSSIAKENEKIRKDALNTWKSIIGNDAYTRKEWRDADASISRMAETARRKAENWRRMAQDAVKAGDDASELEANAQKYESEAEELERTRKVEHKKYLNSTKSEHDKWYSSELNARRAYEDAVLEAMDDTFEKEMERIKLQGEREIEDLKTRLKTEEYLTKEARENINKLIELKEKELQRKLVLSQAEYWSKARENMKSTLSEFSSMMSDAVKGDPNRAVGGFMTDFSESFKESTEKAKKVVETAAKAYNDFLQSPQFRDNFKPELYDELNGNLRKAVRELVHRGNMHIGEDLRQMLVDTYGLTDEDLEKIWGLDKLDELSRNYRDASNRMAAYIGNSVRTAVNENAGELIESFKRNISVSLAFTDDIGHDIAERIGENIDDIDSVIAERTERGAELAKNVVTDAVERLTGVSIPEIVKNIGLGSDFIETTITNALSSIGIVTDNSTDMLRMFVENYESVVEVVSKDSKTSSAVPYLRTLYEQLVKIAEKRNDMSVMESDISGRYKDDPDGETKRAVDLLNLRNAQLKGDKELNEEMLRRAQSIYPQLEQAAKNYNAVETDNLRKIAQAEEQIAEAQRKIDWFKDPENRAFAPKLADEGIAEQQELINKLTDDIERYKGEIVTAAGELTQLGFSSVSDLDKFIVDTQNSIFSINTSIQDNTRQIAENTAQLWINSFTRVASAMSTVGGAFNSLFSNLADMNDEWNEFAMATAYFTIGVDMAQGIAEAVAAGSGVPFPYNIAAIASGIAAVVSGIASAISVYNQYSKPSSPNFAEGGLIGGYARTREEGRRDDVPINASRGEYIINADAVKRYGVAFLDSINGHKALPGATHYADGGYISQMTAYAGNMRMQVETMSSIIAESVENIQPVVSVREITKAQNRVRTAEAISRK